MSPKPTLLKILDVASVIALGIATYLALFYASTELVMGEVQRVFYFHIGTAWTGLLVTCALSVWLLDKRLRAREVVS